MYDIAICDDMSRDAEFLMRRIRRLEKYRDEIRFHEYRSGKELLAAVKEINFSLIFMDICMAELDGEQTAEELRKMDEHVVLVFFTGYANPTLHSVRVQPFRFIKKNMTEEEIDRDLLESLDKMAEEANLPTLKVKAGTRTLILKTDEIVYIEKGNKSVRVYITELAAKRYRIEWDGRRQSNIKASVRLKDVYQLFQPYGFGYPHDSYIVNLKYMTSFGESELFLKGYGTTTFRISRGKMTEFNRIRREFYGGKCGR